MSDFYTKNDWDTVYCWAVDALSDDKEGLLEMIGGVRSDSTFTQLYYEGYLDCGSGVDKSTEVWHCGKRGMMEAIVSNNAGSAFDLIERLIMEFADNGLDLYRLGQPDYVFKFYTDKLVEAVYEDLCEDDNKGLYAIIEPEEESEDEDPEITAQLLAMDMGFHPALAQEDSPQASMFQANCKYIQENWLYRVTTDDGGDQRETTDFNNLEEATSHYHMTSGWHVVLSQVRGSLDDDIIMEKDEDED